MYLFMYLYIYIRTQLYPEKPPEPGEPATAIRNPSAAHLEAGDGQQVLDDAGRGLATVNKKKLGVKEKNLA